MHCAWHRMVLHGIALYLMVLHSFHVIPWYRMVLHGIVLYLTVLHGIALLASARAVSRKTPIYFMALIIWLIINKNFLSLQHSFQLKVVHPLHSLLS